MGDGAEGGVVKVSAGGYSTEEDCWVFAEEGRREKAMRDCEYKRREAGRASLWVKKRCMEAKALFCGDDSVLE